MSIVRAYNEWDPLEEVIVGRIEGARVPVADAGVWAVEYPDAPSLEHIPSGPFPERVIEETAEDLELLVEALEGLGVRVRRPEPHDHARRFRSPDWETDGLANLCPRDVLLPIGETIIEAPMVLRARQYETLPYRSLLTEYFQSGAGWISAPRPRLLDTVYRRPGAGLAAIDESEPLFDAANVLRIGRDILYQVSDSGNHLGARWLQRTLGADYRVHAFHDLYSSTHIDSTLTLVRPGLVVASAERISRENLPHLFRTWDVIYFKDMMDMETIGPPISSVWVGMNFFMVRPDLAVVDRRQTGLIRELSRWGVDVLPLQIRHARTLGGGFHCVTLDVRRRGELDSYCG
jgi:N-dimethylarginine dimethylaminohydrolase